MKTNSLKQKYLKSSAPWWVMALIIPMIIVMEIEPVVRRKLQPMFEPIVVYGKFARNIYKNIFPDNEVGLAREIMFLISVGMAILLLSGW